MKNYIVKFFLDFMFSLLLMFCLVEPCVGAEYRLIKQKNLVVNIERFGAKADGVTDNSTAINKAIDFVYEHGGGIVIIPKRKLSFVFKKILVKSNIELRGEGGILKLADNVAVNASISYYPISNMGYERTIFNNLIVDGNGKNNRDFKVCDVITCVGKESRVSNCYIYDAPDSGIMFSSTIDGICEGNLLSGGRDCAIYVNASFDRPNFGAKIRNNRVENYVVTGIAVKRASINVTVEKNTIYNCGNGITLEDFTKDKMGYPKEISILDNRIAKIGYYDDSRLAKRGISVSRGDRLTIIGNSVENCIGPALYFNEGSNSKINRNSFFSIGTVDVVFHGNNKESSFKDNTILKKIENFSTSKILMR